VGREATVVDDLADSTFAADMCGMEDEVASALFKRIAVGDAANTGRTYAYLYNVARFAVAELALPSNLVVLINSPNLY
jgi:hypothetical protein